MSHPLRLSETGRRNLGKNALTIRGDDIILVRILEKLNCYK
jgi:hypothetical protein